MCRQYLKKKFRVQMLEIDISNECNTHSKTNKRNFLWDNHYFTLNLTSYEKFIVLFRNVLLFRTGLHDTYKYVVMIFELCQEIKIF
jgi:hypothetical protein